MSGAAFQGDCFSDLFVQANAPHFRCGIVLILCVALPVLVRLYFLSNIKKEKGWLFLINEIWYNYLREALNPMSAKREAPGVPCSS